MTNGKLNKSDKQAELEKYRDLILATLVYHLDNKAKHFASRDFDFVEYYKGLKTQTEEHYQKGRLARLKQWFRDMTEMEVEDGDLKFNKYLQEKTKYNIDIFDSYFKRIDKVIEKGKISTDNQFYDISSIVDRLCQSEPIDNLRIEKLNRLLADYEERKTKKKPTA